jgi:hypothetical protein
MALDVLENTPPLFGRGRVIVRPQEPEASKTVLVHETIHLVGRRLVAQSCRAHRDPDSTASRATGQLSLMHFGVATPYSVC